VGEGEAKEAGIGEAVAQPLDEGVDLRVGRRRRQRAQEMRPTT
jgi:hypothetical protein